jgi:hypothetical protein
MIPVGRSPFDHFRSLSSIKSLTLSVRILTLQYQQVDTRSLVRCRLSDSLVSVSSSSRIAKRRTRDDDVANQPSYRFATAFMRLNRQPPRGDCHEIRCASDKHPHEPTCLNACLGCGNFIGPSRRRIWTRPTIPPTCRQLFSL